MTFDVNRLHFNFSAKIRLDLKSELFAIINGILMDVGAVEDARTLRACGFDSMTSS